MFEKIIRFVYKISGILLFDLFIVFFCFIAPDPSMVIGLSGWRIVPLFVALNLIITVVLFLLKRKSAKLFLLNTVFATAITIFLYVVVNDLRPGARDQAWQFEIDNSIYTLTTYGGSVMFLSDYTFGTGVEEDRLRGEYFYRGDTLNLEIYIRDKKVEMYILDNYLYNFVGTNQRVKLKPIEPKK